MSIIIKKLYSQEIKRRCTTAKYERESVYVKKRVGPQLLFDVAELEAFEHIPNKGLTTAPHGEEKSA